MELKVLASLHEDALAGKVWLPANFLKQRLVVKILNSDSSQHITYCQAGSIDRNFVKVFNKKKSKRTDYRINDVFEKVIVMNEHYRDQLGIFRPAESLKPFGMRNFEIEVPKNLLQKLSYSIAATLSHPQDSVRLSAVLGLIGAWLGYFSIFVSVASLKSRTFEKVVTLGVAFVLAVSIYGFHKMFLNTGKQVKS